MTEQERKVSPGVQKLVPVELQAVLWQHFDEHQDLLPSFFNLDRGKKKISQKITHFCLIPYYWEQFQLEHPAPVENVQLVLLQENDGLLLRLRNRKLEESMAKEPGPPQQEELDF